MRTDSSGYVAPLQDMQFILSHLVKIEEIGQLAGYEETTTDLVEAVLNEAGKFAEGVLAPLNRVGDIEGCRLECGNVTTATGWKDAYSQFRADGWVSLSMPAAYGGQNLPKSVSAPVTEMWFGANMAFSLLPPMAAGAVDTLLASANEDLKELYIPSLASGQWTAAMDLTEPGSGSDLGAIRARADRQPDGSYRIFGQKIFITYGDHDLADNVVHLVLARLPGAPPGSRGVSMFLVPKRIVMADGTLGDRNDVRCISIEHKLGIHGSPTCTMSYGESGGAIGYLVGEAGRGLENMFVMVNESRFSVGLQGIAAGERAYQKASAYARTRVQGRDDVTGEPNVPIIRHPDVKRMLLAMRARIMAARMLAFSAAGWFDRAKADPNSPASEYHRGYVNLLMPVVKGWSTELGVQIANMGLQIHGGMGFVEETGAAQFLRDARITTIYEGTTGIQANDLVRRKVLRDGGRMLTHLISDIETTARVALDDKSLNDLGQELANAVVLLEGARDWIVARGATGIGDVLAGGVSFLRLLGAVCGAWQMTRAALVADRLKQKVGNDTSYMQGIVDLARFFLSQVLPEAAMHSIMMKGAGSAVLGYAEDAL